MDASKLWSIAAVPLGVFICFGAALLAWIKAEIKTPDPKRSDGKAPPK